MGLESANTSAGPRCSPTDNDRTWNLGTGRIEDIKRLAPGFFSRSNARWRRQGLESHLEGVTEIRPADLEGSPAFEIITKDVPYRIRALRFDDKVAILATPGECPQLKAIDHCPDGRLKTEIEVDGTAPCLGPLTVPEDHVMITMGSNELLKEKLVFGEPFVLASSAVSVSFSMYLGGSTEPAANISRPVNDFTKPLPEEVIALLRHGGMERPARILYVGIPSDVKTPEVMTTITEARIAGITRATSTARTPREINDLMGAYPKGALPGDQEVARVIGSRIRQLLDELVAADPEPDALFTAAMFSDLYRKAMGERPDLAALEPKYAPLLDQEAFGEARYQGAFMVLFPDSPTTKALEEQEAQEAKQAEADAETRSANVAIEDAWLEVQGRGDEIATLHYKIQFGEQNFVKSRHNQRGLESMRKYRAGLVRDAFCPAKRAFVKLSSIGEFNRRAVEHCKSEAPTDVGIGGAEKVLSTECRAAFATGC